MSLKLLYVLQEGTQMIRSKASISTTLFPRTTYNNMERKANVKSIQITATTQQGNLVYSYHLQGSI